MNRTKEKTGSLHTSHSVRESGKLKAETFQLQELTMTYLTRSVFTKETGIDFID